MPALTFAGRIDQTTLTDRTTGQQDDPRRRAAIQAALSADFIALDDTLVVSPLVLAQHQRYAASDAQMLGGRATTEAAVADIWRADPRLGLRYRPLRGLTLKATGGRYLRVPDFTELFGDRGAMIGNPALRPETGWAWDVGAAGRSPDAPWGRVSGEVAHFWRASSDLIVWSQNSQRTMVPVNVGEAWVQGFEVSSALICSGGSTSTPASPGRSAGISSPARR